MNSYRWKALKDAVAKCPIDPLLIGGDYDECRRYSEHLSTEYIKSLQLVRSAMQRHKPREKYWID